MEKQQESWRNLNKIQQIHILHAIWIQFQLKKQKFAVKIQRQQNKTFWCVRVEAEKRLDHHQKYDLTICHIGLFLMIIYLLHAVKIHNVFGKPMYTAKSVMYIYAWRENGTVTQNFTIDKKK